MSKNFPKSGKKSRPKTAVKGKRYPCAKRRKRSPRPVKTPAPWYCPACLKQMKASPTEIAAGERMVGGDRQGADLKEHEHTASDANQSHFKQVLST